MHGRGGGEEAERGGESDLDRIAKKATGMAVRELGLRERGENEGVGQGERGQGLRMLSSLVQAGEERQVAGRDTQQQVN